MDHTRASVLSVCTAAIIGAGASAGGLEEGAGVGGPADWLDCGVRSITPEERAEILQWAPGPENLEYLSLEAEAIQGMPVDIYLNWLEADPLDPETISVHAEHIGFFIPTSAQDFITAGRIRIDEGYSDPLPGEELPAECTPELICRCWGYQAQWRFEVSNTAGLIQMNDGSSMYVLGLQKEYTLEIESPSVESHSEVVFIPVLQADSVPIVQNTMVVDGWMGNRALAQSGDSQFTVDEVDDLYSKPYRDPSPRTLLSCCVQECIDDFAIQMRQSKQRLDDKIKECQALRIGLGERVGTNLTWGASCAAGTGLIGTGLGAVAGTLLCPGIGTALGAKIGSVMGSSLGFVIGIYACEDIELDDEERRKQMLKCEGEAYLEFESDDLFYSEMLRRCIDRCTLRNNSNGFHPGTGQ